MKRAEVIEKLKAGGTIIYSNGYTSDSFFSGPPGFVSQTVNISTTLWLIKQKLVKILASKTASGLSYLTWRQNEKD